MSLSAILLSQASAAVPGFCVSNPLLSNSCTTTTGFASMYQINRYTATRSYSFLGHLYNSINDKLTKRFSTKNRLSRFVSFNNSFMARSYDVADLECIYNALYTAQFFVPADLYKKYVEALFGIPPRSPADPIAAYKILVDFFNPLHHREAYLTGIMSYFTEKCLSNGIPRVPFCGFYAAATKARPGPSYWYIKTNCKKTKDTKNCHFNGDIFFLPAEILSFKKWLAFSLDFDNFVVKTIARVFPVGSLVAQYDMFVKDYHDTSALDAHNSGDVEYKLLRIKLFSYIIIMSCIPNPSSNTIVKSMHTTISKTFSTSSSMDIVKFVGQSLSIFSK